MYNFRSFLKIKNNRAFSTQNIIPCVSCKNYNYSNKRCNKYYEYDNITGNKTYFFAEYVRKDNSRCGIYNPKLYDSVTLELEKMYAENIYGKHSCRNKCYYWVWQCTFERWNTYSRF